MPNFWTNDWIDQFKKILPTQWTMLNIYPSNPISWCKIIDEPFGNKVLQRGIRKPDQAVQVNMVKQYIDKYAAREIQTIDMPALTDALSIEEEYYAGDSPNALGHVSDIAQNFFDALGQFAVTGTASDPISYGLIDTGPGTGSTTINRPDPCDQAGSLSTTGAWTTYNKMAMDLSLLDNELTSEGFHGRRLISTHPICRPWFRNLLANYTATEYSSVLNYPTVFSEYYDSDATKDAVDVYMFDADAHNIATTPLKARAFFNNDTESFVWHWFVRAVYAADPRHNGTDYIRGAVKLAIDLDGT